MSDLISIIVPVFNAEKYIKLCVDSLINQTYDNIEIILVDDGSTDRSPSICDSFVDERIVVFHNKNLGLSYSRQFGIDHSNGKFFSTIDADDYVAPDFVQFLYQSLVDNNSDIACCDRFDFYGKRKRLVSRKRIIDGIFSVTKEMLSTRYKETCSFLGLSDSWDKMYRSSFVRASGVRFCLPKGFNGNDLLFNYKLVLHCPNYSLVHIPLLMHRLTKGSMVRSSNRPMVASFESIIEGIKKESEICGFSNDMNLELSKVFFVFARLIFIYYCHFSTNYISDIKEAFFNLRHYVSDSDFLSFIKIEKTEFDYSYEFDECFASGNQKKLIRIASKYRMKVILKKIFGVI